VTGAPIVALTGIRLEGAPGFVLDVPELEIAAGQVLAVIGPNGSGKSTLLRVIGLLQAPDTGDVRVHGHLVHAAHALSERRTMAMVFQQPLLADTTVSANVALGLRFRSVPADECGTRVRRWLDRFGIAPLAGRQARTLSGGEAQRVALARALVLEPTLLLLDEPFAALDEPTRSALIPELAGILAAERVATVLVTHDRAEAMTLADRVAVLLGGQLCQVDDTSTVFQSPVSEEVARFVGVETIVSGEVVALQNGVSLVDVAGRKLEVATPARPGERVRICIRPEDVTLAQAPVSAALSSARNHLAGTVARVTPSALQVRVVVDVGFPLVAALTRRSVEELGLAEGRAITAIFKASAAHLIRAA
jgi:molybdopterin-binding protein